MSAKVAATWFAELAKLASDDTTRPSICRTAVKVAEGVWALTNGHYALVLATPPELRAWDATVPVAPTVPWPMDELAVQAKAGALPAYDAGKIGEVRHRDNTFPDVSRVLNCAPADPVDLPDLGKVLAEIDAAIARAKVDCAPAPAVAVAAKYQGIKLDKPGLVLDGVNQLTLWVDDSVYPPQSSWTCKATKTTWVLDGKGVACHHQEPVTLGAPVGKAICGLDIRYLRRFAKLGGWGGGVFDWRNGTKNPADMRWGAHFAVLMPQKL